MSVHLYHNIGVEVPFPVCNTNEELWETIATECHGWNGRWTTLIS